MKSFYPEKGRGRVIGLILVLLLLMGGPLVLPVLAEANDTVLSFSDQTLLSHDNLRIYHLNGTGGWELIAGTYNTTSAGIVLPPGQYSILVEASGISTALDNPGKTLFEDPSNYILDHFEGLMVAIILIGIVLLAWRKR